MTSYSIDYNTLDKVPVVINTIPEYWIDQPSFDIEQLDVVIKSLIPNEAPDAETHTRYQMKNGTLMRQLVIIDDNSDQDPEYNTYRAWLLNARQGDQYDRTSDYVTEPVSTRHEQFNELGYSMLTEGWYWSPLPLLKIPRLGWFDTAIQRFADYQDSLDE